MPDPGCQILDTRSWLSDLGYQILHTRSWMPDPGYQTRSWTPDPGCQSLHTRSWTTDPGCQIPDTRGTWQMPAAWRLMPSTSAQLLVRRNQIPDACWQMSDDRCPYQMLDAMHQKASAKYQTPSVWHMKGHKRIARFCKVCETP